MEIRKLKVYDTQQFCDLIINMYSHLNNLEWFTPMPFDFDTVKSIIENPRFYIIGAFENDELCGVSSLDYKCGKLIGKISFPKNCDTSKLVEIGFNIVHTNHRGKKIMQTLIGELLLKLKTDNFEWVFTKVHDDNIASNKSFFNKEFKFFCHYKKEVDKKDFKSLSNEIFFCQEGKQNAIKALEKFKNSDYIVVNYSILIKQL